MNNALSVYTTPGTHFKSACGLRNYFQHTWPDSSVGKSKSCFQNFLCSLEAFTLSAIHNPEERRHDFLVTPVSRWYHLADFSSSIPHVCCCDTVRFKDGLTAYRDVPAIQKRVRRRSSCIQHHQCLLRRWLSTNYDNKG